MKKFLPIAAVIVVIGIIIAVVAGNNNNNSSNSTTPPPSNSSTQSSTNTPPASPLPTADNNKVTIHDLGFSPADISVKKGTTVTWTNNDSVSHTVTSDTGTTMNSDTLDQGESYTAKFDTVGTFPYHCNFHSSMHGKVTVTE